MYIRVYVCVVTCGLGVSHAQPCVVLRRFARRCRARGISGEEFNQYLYQSLHSTGRATEREDSRAVSAALCPCSGCRFLLIADFRAEVLKNGADGADRARGRKVFDMQQYRFCEKFTEIGQKITSNGSLPLWVVTYTCNMGTTLSA